jgi:hypothetical protein
MLLATLLLINPPVSDGTTLPPGNLMVSIAWPEGNDDVDLWVDAPGQAKPVGYSNRGGAVWNLLRDDLGNGADGTPLNYENAYARGLPAGEYIVNLHGYRTAGSVPVDVEVRIGGVGKSMALVWSGKIAVRNKQEITAVRFRIDAEGRVVPGSATHIFKALRS